MVLLAGSGASVLAQPVASIALPPPRGTVQLYSGCNNIALSFPDGTDSQTVVNAVTPAGVVEAMWRHDAAQNRFEGVSPAAPQASDLLTVNQWDAVWLCVAAAPLGWTTLNVDGVEAWIYRDQWGIPHIFARSNRALFEAYGYTVAEDRLWQLELDRRAARGTLAEILGPSLGDADEVARRDGYTDAELDAQIQRSSQEDREISKAYIDGINRYIRDVVQTDPANKLPYEFKVLGFMPAPWTEQDSAAFGAFMARRFGEIGGKEMTNQALLKDLVDAHGLGEGWAMFNDLTWINDADAPVTIPPPGASQVPPGPAATTAAQVQLAAAGVSGPQLDEARQLWASLGVPVKLGSYAWAISPVKSANGAAMLYGGPQMGFDTPAVIHEVQLQGGNGFDVMGMAFAGAPPVLIGRNKDIAWTSTTATGDNVDTYVETLCGPTSYMFNGVCTPMEVRQETINVRVTAPGTALATEPRQLTVMRTVHGPVISVDAANGVAYSQKRAHWQREYEAIHSFLQFDRAHNVAQFDAAARLIVTSHNLLYADKAGNIAYWQAGQVPIRPAGYDPRLPLPGTGEAEWPGGTIPMPVSVNPPQGWLANWNNKPAVWYQNSDSAWFGKQDRILDIQQRLAGPQLISLQDMFDIPKDIARVKELGREARYLRPYLLSALAAVPSSHPLVPQAKTVLEAWNENVVDDALTSTEYDVAYTIFWVWKDKLIYNVFGDELGAHVSDVDANVLLHTLDGPLSNVPPHVDYFNGADRNTVIVRSLEEALDSIGYLFGTTNMPTWLVPRGEIVFKHPLGIEAGRIPLSNRSTYGQVIVLDNAGVTGYNIIPLGQSGFISPSGELDAHFRDQLDLYRNFEYKQMHFYKNVGLAE
jgi:penicillin amidase